jgi:NADPH:quinone reductase-like Zn-dependent oxidoreductase
MRAAAIDAWGQEPRVRELEDPPVGPDTVLVRVRAAGVNPVDWKIVEGRLAGGFRHAFPLVPGWDAAGVVEAVGPAVTRFAPGDEVWTYARKDLLRDGTYAELVGMREDAVAHKPAGLSFEEAGATPLAALTALQVLRDGLAVQDGERVVVLAASGGVGTFAVQLATAMGAEVVAVSSAPNHGLVCGLGAREAVDYREQDVARAVGRADAVADLVGGGEPLARALGARLCSIIAPPEEGTYVFVRPGAADLDVLAGHVAAGRLRVELEDVLPLDRAAEALARSRQGRVRGKLVLTP